MSALHQHHPHDPGPLQTRHRDSTGCPPRPRRATTVRRLAELEAGHVEDGTLVFESPGSLRRALDDGVFHLEIPGHVDLTVADRAFGGGCAPPPLRPAPPAHLATLEQQLTVLGTELLRSVLSYAGVPARDRAAVGGREPGRIIPNHPRAGDAEPDGDGRDTVLTMLRTHSAGLQVGQPDGWSAIPLDSRFFVIFLGRPLAGVAARAGRPLGTAPYRLRHQDGHPCGFRLLRREPIAG